MAATYNLWPLGLLSEVRAPTSITNIRAMQLWAQSEGMPPSENNPLATSWDGYGGVAINATGVKRYPTITDGVHATAATLALPAYNHIVTALVTTAGLVPIWQAINASPWCRGCQGGKYPVALYDALAGSVTGTSTTQLHSTTPMPVTVPPISNPPFPAPVIENVQTTWAVLDFWVQSQAQYLINQLATLENVANTIAAGG